jgi:hypothetical protein
MRQDSMKLVVPIKITGFTGKNLNVLVKSWVAALASGHGRVF